MLNPLHDALFAPHRHSDAVVFQSADGALISYRSFLDLAHQYAQALVVTGVRPGDRVAFQIEKSPQAMSLYAAIIMAGAVVLPLNNAYTSSELAYFIADCEPCVFVCDPALEAELHNICRPQTRVLTLDAQGLGSLASLAAGHSHDFEVVGRKPDDLAALLYTSGTTGRSKGAMLTHDNLLSNAKVLAEYWQFTPDDILLHALPIFHTHGLFVACNISFYVGSSMVLLPRFDLNAIVAKLPEVSVMMGVPTFYTRLLGDARCNRDLTRDVRLFISGSAPLQKETSDVFAQRTGHRILERYGMTETNMSVSNPYFGERRPGTVGFPLPGVELVLRNRETGEVCAPGDVGMIEVRGPNVFKGYWGMPEKTAAELREDGFFITGDIGVLDSDGYLQIVGRDKDMIISGGFNVYPKEVEELLDDSEDILESAVIGVPHPDLGEAVVAVVVAVSGHTIDTGSELARLRLSLANYKQPKQIFIIADLPRNAMGKVQKSQVRQQYADAFDALA